MSGRDPVVRTEAGLVRGFWEEKAAVFLGVPYAEVPLGPHRLQAPVPRKAWDGVREARVYGATAPQPGVGFTIIPEPVVEGDDCLNLNVFTPDPAATTGLPVLVWIHGGGFVTGCSASPWYRGNRFARDGVVVVSLNYRLGAEGFMAVEGAPANRGALDWVAGLEWVRANIARFGGDPDHVTVAGQSAGGVACLALLAMPRARGLFHRAVSMSGAALFSGSTEGAQRTAAAIAEGLGCRPRIEDIREVSPEALVEAARAAASGGRPLSGPGLLVDGDVLPIDPLRAVEDGSAPDVPLLVGSTRDEAIPGLIGIADKIDEDRFGRRMARLGLDAVQTAVYRDLLPDEPRWRVLARATSDSMFRLNAARLADLHAGSGRSRTFSYEFRWPSPALGGIGACHCIDLPFVFDNLDAYWVDTVAGTNPPQALADGMHAAWVRFVKDGDAGWEPYDPEHRPVMVFDTDSAVATDPLAAERQIWGPTPSRD